MRDGTKDGGDGVRCWNKAAIAAYVQAVDRREQQVAAANPDVRVLPGTLSCYGCEVMEYGYGIKCTATLTRTRYAVRDELEPRVEDARASLQEVEGMLTRAPDEVEARLPAGDPPAAVAGPAAGAHPAAPAEPVEPRRGGLRGLLRR